MFTNSKILKEHEVPKENTSKFYSIMLHKSEGRRQRNSQKYTDLLVRTMQTVSTLINPGRKGSIKV